MSEEDRILPTDLGLGYDEGPGEILNFKEAREKFEKEFLQKALARNKGKITHVAKEIGISRPAIYEKIKRYDIQI